MSPFRLTASSVVVAAPLLALALLRGAPVAAQDDALWNTPQALKLVERAREARQSVVVDSMLQSYTAQARGFVYFFLDRKDSEERTLVKTDQVALDVFWRAPGETRQRIVGLRDQKSLPTRIQYHLDHLTVVQDEFGDRIRLGDGDEVASVIHPVATGAETIYDYRVSDSLTLDFGGAREPVRVYEIEVRPRDLDRPGFVGTLYLDRATASIVRMNFTFTPPSYVDPYLDYIRISLDNGLWMGRYWLPYRQEAEIRRELPQLDFLAGSVIRGRFDIGHYTFNDDLPDRLFAGRSVLAVPEAERRAFPFDEPIFAELDEEGLEPSSSMEALTAQARQIVRNRALTGLQPTRLYWSSVSDALRYDRAEGLYTGLGTSIRLPAELALRLHGGWSFGRDLPSARVELASSTGTPATHLIGEWRGLRDIGPVEASSGVFNSLASLAGEDWTDPWFVTGARLSHRLGAADGRRVVGTLSWLDHRSAYLAVNDAGGVFRPVRPIREGVEAAAAMTMTLPAAIAGIDLIAGLRAARLDGRDWLKGSLEARFDHQPAGSDFDVEVSFRGAFAAGSPPPQALFLLGGRGTLPGHAHRRFVGDRFWLARARAGRTVAAPWFGVHITAAIGESFMAGNAGLPPGWTGDPDAGLRGSAGAGVDLLWGVIALDVARGIGPGGDWALVVGVNPRFHPWL